MRNNQVDFTDIQKIYIQKLNITVMSHINNQPLRKYIVKN